MKKFFALLLSLVLLLSLAACGQDASNGDVNKNNGEENSTGVQVDEGLFNVDVTLPAALFDSMTEEDIKKTAEENGYSGCVVHEDGSVTYTMTKTKHKEMLEELKKSMDESIKNLTEGENAVASFMSIDYTDDYSEVNIQVNADEYTQWDNFYALAFYMTGAYYQSFAGVAPDKIDVVVHFIDGDTKEVLSTASYRDYVNEMESSGDANHSNESSGV